jgi:hypothetical protein
MFPETGKEILPTAIDERLGCREEDHHCAGVTQKGLVGELGLSPVLLAFSSGISHFLKLSGPSQTQGGHAALGWCSPGPGSPLLPGKHNPFPYKTALLPNLWAGAKPGSLWWVSKLHCSFLS